LSSFKAITAHYQARVEQALHDFLPTEELTDATLLQASEYSLFNGGKRLRPLLVFLTGELFAANEHDLNKIAAAIECVHSYSLVHDDLPAMDDDDLRRGRPTCHIAFDEASAILAGDALQTLAFEIISKPMHTDANIQLKIIAELAKASGLQGMCGGQALDIAATNRLVSQQQLERIHKLKTGALLCAAVRMGALAGNASEAQLAALSLYAEAIGLAFQVQDDILDIEGDTHTLGKPQGSDIAANKSTYPAILGLESAKQFAKDLVNQAILALQQLEGDTSRLQAVAEYIIARDH
jgi:farnesyl diphosphate synthase